MKLRTVQKIALGLGALFVAAGAAGCSADASADRKEVTTLRYLGSGGGGSVTYAELADALGYLDGVKLKNVGTTAGGPALIQGVATDQIDFGGPFNSTIISAKARKTPVTAVIGYLGTNADSPTGFFTQEDSGITTARDLIGKKVGLNTLGAAQEAFLDEYLLQNGFTGQELKKVIRVTLPMPNFEVALRKKRVDLVPFMGALETKAKQGGGIRQLFSAHEILGNFTQASYVMHDDFIKDNPATTKKFVSGVAKAIIWDQTHTREEVIDVYSTWLKEHGREVEIPLLKLWKTQAVANVGGAISPGEFSTWINWLEQTGEIEKGSVKPEDVYTNEFNPYGKDIRPAAEAGEL